MITWKQIVDYNILGEFDLLRQAQTDIQQEDWAKLVYWEATVKYFKLCWAREEVAHVEVEVHWLWTAIHDEEQAVKETIDHLNQTDHWLGKELEIQQHYCSSVNLHLLFCLNQIEAFPGYGGHRGIGHQQTMLPVDDSHPNTSSKWI